MLYVGNYALVDEADLDDDTIPFFRLADDIDEDGFPAAGFIIDPVTGQLLLFTDFDDLHEFNVFFDNITMRSQTQVRGVETMWTHELTNNHYMAKHQNNRVTVGAGARFMQLYDDFQFLGEGSILGRTFYDTTFTNNVVGPQIQAQWTNQRQRWRIEADARAMFGYNIANWRQQGVMGEELIPGALNRPLYARPTAFSHGLTEHNFSPVGEMRLQAKYQFTRGFSANFGYTGSVMANIKRAATSVRYRLPDFGYVDSGAQTLLSNGFDFGVEFVH
jgi:hypothetical protein